MAILGAAHAVVVVDAQMAMANQLGDLQQKRPVVGAVHQQQAGSGLGEVLSTWCDRDHIDRLLVQHHLAGEAASTAEEKATIAAQLEATAEVEA